MSRTWRNKRPMMRLGEDYKIGPNGKVRDGTPTHAAGSCEHHGGCPWCEGNRMYRHKKREPVEERY